MIDLEAQPCSLAEFMADEYTAAIASVDKSLESLRGLWKDAKYEEIRDQVIESIDSALDKRLELMAKRGEWMG